MIRLSYLPATNGGLSKPALQVPLRAGKGWAYEGYSSALIVKWLGIQAGVMTDTPITSMDFYPRSRGLRLWTPSMWME